MSKIPITIDLLETNSQIEYKILDGITRELNKRISNNIDNIKKDISSETFNHFKNTKTYNSLIDGELAGQFGLPPSVRKSYVDNILWKIVSNIEVDFKNFYIRSSKIAGGLEIRVLLRSFSDILSMIDSTIMTEKGFLLPWLQWLLLEGDRIIVSQHEVQPNIKGRSKEMIMIKSNAGVWRVPPEYSGVRDDNWLTRAILDESNGYLKMVEKIIEKALT